MKTIVLAVSALAFVATTTMPAIAKQSSRYAMNDQKFNLKSSPGIQKFWMNSTTASR
jgi:hypothetical protein